MTSNPPGAQVFFEGKEIGTTPSFVQIPRKSKGSLHLRLSNGNEIEQPLESSYRWGDSFFSNLIWALWGAPIGWGIDLLSGASWDYQPIPPVQGSQEDIVESESHPAGHRVLVIAPPQQSYELLSDELGRKMIPIASQHFPQDQILDFETTQPIFNSFTYNHKQTVRETYRDKLYYELKATHILESTTERNTQGVLLHSKLTDIYSDRTIHSFSEMIPDEQLKSTHRGSFFETLTSLISIVPNTVFFDFTDSTLNFIPDSNSNTAPYTPVSEKDDSALTLLTSFAFRNSRSPKLDELKGVFRLIPDINFYYDRFHFTRGYSNQLQGIGFSWFSLAAGFGPEFGLESPIGYFYLDIIPSIAMNWITSSVNSSTRGTIELDAEVGYSIFVSQRIVLRLFGRAITGSAGQWSAVLSDAGKEPLPLLGVAHGIFGLSIGYYFPEAKSLIKKGML